MTTERRNISQPADWWQAFEREAKRRKMNLSEWIGQSCLLNLSSKNKLSDRPPAHRPKQEHKQ